jgi:predicted metal-dependent HD superfamily phosphohydrolase
MGKSQRRLSHRVCRLILATKTHESDGQAEQALMLDVDLSILGSEPIHFSEYERQIRQEYSWVPLEVSFPNGSKSWRSFSTDRESSTCPGFTTA